ncbi:MAG: hypothetical protein PVH17_12800 [Anaerolineae bacterium]
MRWYEKMVAATLTASAPCCRWTAADATRMCILVANEDHSVQQNMGNGYPSP